MAREIVHWLNEASDKQYRCGLARAEQHESKRDWDHTVWVQNVTCKRCIDSHADYPKLALAEARKMEKEINRMRVHLLRLKRRMSLARKRRRAGFTHG